MLNLQVYKILIYLHNMLILGSYLGISESYKELYSNHLMASDNGHTREAIILKI